MNTMQLDVQKAFLAREILNSTDENMLAKVWNFMNNSNKPSTAKKRKLGFLKGKSTFSVVRGGKISEEEFLAL